MSQGISLVIGEQEFQYCPINPEATVLIFNRIVLENFAKYLCPRILQRVDAQ